ncbi:hypothetical protein [Spiroplasma endosymbiont of Cantharis nigra]|uniref:hypothetical protein n=1 Tax=Spiroplasma endosymbiont of Cantharis nigra TaxID=3066278 RepID=UPI0030D3836E
MSSPKNKQHYFQKALLKKFTYNKSKTKLNIYFVNEKKYNSEYELDSELFQYYKYYDSIFAENDSLDPSEFEESISTIESEIGEIIVACKSKKWKKKFKWKYVLAFWILSNELRNEYFYKLIKKSVTNKFYSKNNNIKKIWKRNINNDSFKSNNFNILLWLVRHYVKNKNNKKWDQTNLLPSEVRLLIKKRKEFFNEFINNIDTNIDYSSKLEKFEEKLLKEKISIACSYVESCFLNLNHYILYNKNGNFLINELSGEYLYLRYTEDLGNPFCRISILSPEISILSINSENANLLLKYFNEKFDLLNINNMDEKNQYLNFIKNLMPFIFEETNYWIKNNIENFDFIEIDSKNVFLINNFIYQKARYFIIGNKRDTINKQIKFMKKAKEIK